MVLKGNSIRHNGEVYRENVRIPVSGKDAERLLAAGVIADVQVLRQRVLSAAPAVSVTTELTAGRRLGLHLLSPLHGVFGDEHEYPS